MISSKKLKDLNHTTEHVAYNFRIQFHIFFSFFFLQNAKAECDKVIDKNGPPPIGTGIKQLRENIAESKLSYEIMDDAGE